ncbi:MAG: DUF4974 domain-containing protein [Bacteroidota bacterium]|nr:DUF4974 domain-containing protein [Bacteroidota bacterium]
MTRLIYKVLSGEADEAEKKEVRTWIDMNPRNAEEFDDIRLVYEAELNFDESVISGDDSLDDGWLNLQQRIFRFKRQQHSRDLVKTLATATLISTIVFAAIFYYVSSNATLAYQDVDSITSTALLSDKLAFQDATLESVFDVLHSRYGIKIRVNNAEVTACKFSGTFSRGILVDDVLRTLARSENLQLESKSGGTFEFKGMGCSE